MRESKKSEEEIDKFDCSKCEDNGGYYVGGIFNLCNCSAADDLQDDE